MQDRASFVCEAFQLVYSVELIVVLPGTRYYMRGVDDEGEVANFVETEQILCFQGEFSSYVQVMHAFAVVMGYHVL